MPGVVFLRSGFRVSVFWGVGFRAQVFGDLKFGFGDVGFRMAVLVGSPSNPLHGFGLKVEHGLQGCGRTRKSGLWGWRWVEDFAAIMEPGLKEIFARNEAASGPHEMLLC